MTYSIEFYALKEHDFAARLQSESPALLSELEARLRAEDEDDDGDDQESDGESDDDDDDEVIDHEASVSLILDAARRICQNDLPADCGEEYFCAFWWLLELTSERITICDFQDVRHLSYLEDIGIWPWFQRRTPSFPLPRSSESYPSAGFLSRQDMPEFVTTGIESIPPPRVASTASYALNARDELQHVVSTLIDDQLDLVAVLQ